MRDGGFQHRALIYRDPGDFLAGTLPFLWAGLEAGERILVAVGPEQTSLLENELGTDAGWVGFVDMRELGRNPAAIIPLWREFVAEGGGVPVRGIGEPVWAARSAVALEECQRHECLLNVAFDQGPDWTLLCPYDASSLGDEMLAEVADSHPLICQHGRCDPSPSFVADRDCFSGALPPAPISPRTFYFEVAGLAEVRRRVGEEAERAGMDSTGIADLVTAASELAANSVMHGGGGGTLRLWSEEERLIVEVEDEGRIEEPLAGRVKPEVSQEGGRGLWLANRLCDLVQIRSGDQGTTVRLHAVAREAAYV